MSKSMISFAIDLSPSMYVPVNRDDGYSKLDLAKAIVTHFITKERLRSKTCQYQIITYGDEKTNNYLNSTQGAYEYVNEIESFREADPETIVKVVREVGTKAGNDCKRDCTPVDAVGVSLDAMIRTNAGKKYNKLMFLITDGEFMFHENDVEDLEAMVHTMVNTDMQFHVGVVGNKLNSTNIRRENISCLKDVAQKTGGSLIEIETLVDSLYMFGDKSGIGTKPTLSKMTIELSPSLRVPVVSWTKVMSSKPPVMKTILVKGAARAVPSNLGNYSTYDYLKDDEGIFLKGDNYNYDNDDDKDIKNKGIVKRDTVYVLPSDMMSEDPRIFEKTELIKGYKYGQMHVPVQFPDAFVIKGAMKIQILGYVEAARVSITSHLEAPIIIQGALDSGAIAGSFNMISQQVVYVLAQAMADTNTVAIVRYVKKDDADPQVMVLRPNPSCVDATLYMYRIPFREDSNQFIFPSLDDRSDVTNISGSQRTAVSALVDSMTILPTRKRMTPYNTVLHNIFKHIQDNIISEDKSIATILDSLRIDPFDTMSVYNNNNETFSNEQKVIGEHIKNIFHEFKLHKKVDKREIKKNKWTDFVASTETLVKELQQDVIASVDGAEFDVNQRSDSTYIAKRIEMFKNSKQLLVDFNDLIQHYPYFKKEQTSCIFNELKRVLEDRIKEALGTNNSTNSSSDDDIDTLEETVLLYRVYAIKTETSNEFNDFLKQIIQPLLVRYQIANRSLSSNQYSQYSQPSQLLYQPTPTGPAKVLYSLKKIYLITDGGGTSCHMRDAYEYANGFD